LAEEAGRLLQAQDDIQVRESGILGLQNLIRRDRSLQEVEF
jgi:hypothetical protein